MSATTREQLEALEALRDPVPTTVTLPRAQRDALDDFASRLARTRSCVIREAVALWLQVQRTPAGHA